MKRQSVLSELASNDNEPGKTEGIHISTNLPDTVGILDGEVELVSRYLGHLLANLANDND